MAFFVEVGTGIAAKLLEHQLEKSSARITTFAKELRERFSDGSLGIFIVGPQGTGKSTALGILSGEKEVNDIPTEYSSSPKNEIKKFKGHFFFKAFAGPGQPDLKNIHWPALYQKAAKFDRVLFIFCTSYGHHSIFEEDFTSIKSESLNRNDTLAIKDYLETRRATEANLFTDFVKELAGVKGKIGLMLLVTKQDLWWEQREDVAAFYSRGSFAKGFRELESAKRAVGFVQGRQSASLSLQNLLTSDRKLLVPTTAGYDQLLQRLNYLMLMHSLETMVNSLTEQ